MPGRKYEGGSGYRFGFNGKEDDKDFGNIQDYGFRLYNPSLGKFLSVDPLMSEYPWYTPYQFAGNMPIAAIDIDGAEPGRPEYDWVNSVNYHDYGNHYGQKSIYWPRLQLVDNYFVHSYFDHRAETHKFQYFDAGKGHWLEFTPNNYFNPQHNAMKSNLVWLYSPLLFAAAPVIIAEGVAVIGTGVLLKEGGEFLLEEGLNMAAPGLGTAVTMLSPSVGDLVEGGGEIVVKREAKEEMAKSAKDAAYEAAEGAPDKYVTSAFKTKDGTIYTGHNKDIKSMDEVHPELKDMLPEKSEHRWPTYNCAECSTFNKAAKDGYKKDDILERHTVNRNENGTISDFPDCKNCAKTFKDIPNTVDK